MDAHGYSCADVKMIATPVLEELCGNVKGKADREQLWDWIVFNV